MTAVLIIAAAIVLLVIGYVFYGNWLAKEWGIDPKRETPAVTSLAAYMTSAHCLPPSVTAASPWPT